METTKEATAAIIALHGSQLDGRFLTVQFLSHKQGPNHGDRR